MTITNTNGVTVATGKGIAYVRLCSLKGKVTLESKGMTSRMGAIRPRIADEFGLKPRAPYADYIAAIQAKMNTMLTEAQQETLL